MPRHVRLLSLVACLVLLVATGCRRGKPAATEEPTLEPEPTAGVESLGDFQLVGTVQQAFLTIDPGIELPSDSGTAPTPGSEQDTPEVAGVMRVTLEAFSDNLGDKCGADKDDRFNVFWTRSSLFDDSLLTGDLEQRLDGRRVGVIGNIFLKPLEAGQGTDEDEFFTPEPTEATTPAPQALPGATDQEGETNCVLVAEQLGISTGTALPSASPRATRTPTPRPTVTAAPTPLPTRSPTPKPSSPAPTDTAEPTPTSPAPSPTTF